MSGGSPTRIFLSPGMFGFARIASLEYFGHFKEALTARFRRLDRAITVRVCDVHPTASIRRRAAVLARTVAAGVEPDADAPIHLVGHSTGGLDARLVASPSVHLPGLEPSALTWLPRLRSITTINAPHHGTPIASFFATAGGQRLLYALSAVTVTALKLGAPPLAAASALVAAFGRVDHAMGFELDILDRTTDAVIRVLDDASSHELRLFLRDLRDDQGAVVQLTPEAMDLFQAGVEDRHGVRYQCVASYAPRQGVTDWLATLRSPWGVLSATLFTLLGNIAARQDPRYPCAPPDGSAEASLRRVLGVVPPSDANDGVVPLCSQVWGELIWAGPGDHLDVVGHYGGPGGHTDWLASGSRFDETRFAAMIDRIVEGMVAAEMMQPMERRRERLGAEAG